jgi:Contractile injection system tube protein
MPLERIQILNEQTQKKIVAMFNPEEYSLNKDNNYASQAIPGLISPLLQFVHGNLQTLDMELFFDTYEQQTDVRKFPGALCICAASWPKSARSSSSFFPGANRRGRASMSRSTNIWTRPRKSRRPICSLPISRKRMS